MVSFIIAALALVAGGAATAFSFLFSAPILYPKTLLNVINALTSGGDLRQIGENYEILPYRILCFSILGFGVLLTVLGILLAVSASDAKKRRMALIRSTGLSNVKISRTEFSDHMEVCLENFALCTAHDETVRMASGEADRLALALNNRLTECLSALSVFDVTPEQPTVPTVTDALRTTADILSAICGEKERLEGEIRNAKVLTTSLRDGLGGYNERTLRSVVGENDPARILASTDMEKIEMAHRYHKEQLAAATAKRISVEKELIALSAASENPAKLYAKLDEVTAELRERRFQYESVIMAIEAIASASDSLRRSVTPRIREKAGTLMGKITDGKYAELGVAQDMSVHVFAGNSTRSIDVLSKGTRDAAYLSLRIALADLVCAGNLPPLTLDKSLSLLDESRATNMLSMLCEYTNGGGQCLLFTCHKREGQLMSAIGSYNHIQLS